MSTLGERSRRLRLEHDSPHLFAALRAGEDLAVVARKRGLPLAHVRGVQSFYDALHELTQARCVGTACWLADGAPLDSGHGVHCRGRCYAPHADAAAEIPHHVPVATPVVLRHLHTTALCSRADPRPSTPDVWSDYELPDGETILNAVEQSGLRGRGGAAFPTGRKWRAARETPAPERVVVANGDEGDPGAYIDRLLLEKTPHAVLAGMVACARAIAARTGILFVRGEYPRAADAVEAAIGEARERGLLPDFDVRVIRGAGSYVAGEETALLRAIEGQRAEPSPKPPFPAQRGAWGLPTVVQNVETLSVIPWVVRNTARPETKAFSLAGAVSRPGVYEADFGTSLSQLLAWAGGELPGRAWKMALIGGPMGRVLPVARFDAKLDYDALPGLGHGGIVVMDQQVSARALFHHLSAFARSESCGNCTPCRAGTAQLDHVTAREPLERLLRTLSMGSLCGFGQGVPRPLFDLIEHFGAELFP